jgi:catalase
MQMSVPPGQVNYEPSSLGADVKHESQGRGYQTFAAPEEGEQLRVRPESFADHYSQARLFFASQTEPEQNHIVSALVFELSKCLVPRVREAVLSRLIHINQDLAMRVAAGLGIPEIVPAELPVEPQDMKPSPALSIIAKAVPTLRGRKVGCLVTDGTDDDLLNGLKRAVEAAGATFDIIAPRIGGITTAGGTLVPANHKVEGGPSVLFDAVAIIPSREGGAKLGTQAEAVNFLRDAFGHLKVIGYTPTAAPLLVKAGMPEANPDNDAGMISLGASAPEDFVAAAAAGRIWNREPYVRDVP